MWITRAQTPWTPTPGAYEVVEQLSGDDQAAKVASITVEVTDFGELASRSMRIASTAMPLAGCFGFVMMLSFNRAFFLILWLKKIPGITNLYR